MLEATELAPRVVELARHTEVGFAVPLEKLRTQGHKVISAPRGRQVLKLVVCLVRMVFRPVHIRAAVVKYGCIGRIFPHHGGQVLHHFYVPVRVVFLRIGKARWVKPTLPHSLDTVGANTVVTHEADVIENAVRHVKLLAQITGHTLNLVKVGADGTKRCPRAMVKRVIAALLDLLAHKAWLSGVEIDVVPLGMLVGIQL